MIYAEIGNMFQLLFVMRKYKNKQIVVIFNQKNLNNEKLCKYIEGLVEKKVITAIYKNYDFVFNEVDELVLIRGHSVLLFLRAIVYDFKILFVDEGISNLSLISDKGLPRRELIMMLLCDILVLINKKRFSKYLLNDMIDCISDESEEGGESCRVYEEPLVYIIGQPLCVDGYIDSDEYYVCINEIAKINNAIYIPHPREDIEVVSGYVDREVLMEINGPLELFLMKIKNNSFVKIYGHSSSSLLFAKSMGIQIELIYFKKIKSKRLEKIQKIIGDVKVNKKK